MNAILQMFQGKKTHFTCLIVLALIFGAWQKWWVVPDQIYAGLGVLAVMFLRAGVSREIGQLNDAASLLGSPAPGAAAPSPDTSGPGAAGKAIVPLFIVTFAIAVLLGACAPLQPGADPLVVRVEQAQSSAKPGFDFILTTENENRQFWRTNTPGFYDFCEWLRKAQPVSGMTAFGTNIAGTLPRASAMQWNLDQVKQAYKQGRATSNSVFEVLAPLESAVAQAASWSVVTTNGPAK